MQSKLTATLVLLPGGANGVFNVYKHDGENILFPSRQQWAVIDAHTGKVLYRSNQTKPTPGDIFADWQLALHSGEVFGLSGRLIVMLAGLVVPVLYVTGVVRWLQKRRARIVKNKRTFPTVPCRRRSCALGYQRRLK